MYKMGKLTQNEVPVRFFLFVMLKEHEVLKKKQSHCETVGKQKAIFVPQLTGKINAYDEKSGSKEHCFDLHIKVLRKLDPKIVTVCESFSHDASPLLTDTAHRSFIQRQNLRYKKETCRISVTRFQRKYISPRKPIYLKIHIRATSTGEERSHDLQNILLFLVLDGILG